MGYFGTPRMTLNEEPQGQMSACLYKTHISVMHITDAVSGYLFCFVFQNEAKFN